MTEKPPSDPATHAADFSQRYSEGLDIASGQVMIDLGLADNEMGVRDPDRNREHHTFFSNERSCGSVSPAGQINLDSGVMNPAAMDGPYGEACGELWRKSRLRDRMQAIVAHEKAEGEYGQRSRAGPDRRLGNETLPITDRARAILRAMEAGWKGYSR